MTTPIMKEGKEGMLTKETPYKLKVELMDDTTGLDPRDDDNAGTMVVFWNRYTLGDHENHYDLGGTYYKPELVASDELVREMIENEAKANDKTLQEWMEYVYPDMTLREAAERDQCIDFYGEGVLSPEEAPLFAAIVAADGGVVLPLSIYEHSGITISYGTFSYGWDSGPAGFIYITKKQMEKEGWDKEHATKYMQGEVECYDTYLTGMIYEWSVVDTDDEDDHLESCGGYFQRSDAEVDGKYTLEQMTKEFFEQQEKDRLEKIDNNVTDWVRETWKEDV